ncbi:hypothetical protein KP509_15G060100 [Ceratopteris richardii]|uniref:Uncharacterized protein n=1 Tax=Ceratopteris richardii TaxID=49495 RepID=A0A8T2TA54_CERRI|nr:hypothetical protein KP509_15G060100 [Ceratopteris richardii]
MWMGRHMAYLVALIVVLVAWLGFLCYAGTIKKAASERTQAPSVQPNADSSSGNVDEEQPRAACHVVPEDSDHFHADLRSPTAYGGGISPYGGISDSKEGTTSIRSGNPVEGHEPYNIATAASASIKTVTWPRDKDIETFRFPSEMQQDAHHLR